MDWRLDILEIINPFPRHSRHLVFMPRQVWMDAMAQIQHSLGATSGSHSPNPLSTAHALLHSRTFGSPQIYPQLLNSGKRVCERRLYSRTAVPKALGHWKHPCMFVNRAWVDQATIAFGNQPQPLMLSLAKSSLAVPDGIQLREGNLLDCVRQLSRDTSSSEEG
jgi:hypothetical protein